VFKGVEYDATDYAENHPGGLTFLDNMKAMTKDFTEYFRYYRSYSELYTPTGLKRY
jgi:cytochrome b involved in lipid metabolism